MGSEIKKPLKTKWRDDTLKLLQNRPASLKLKDVAIQTGIPLGWLSMFQRGQIDGPDVNRIETLHDLLSNL